MAGLLYLSSGLGLATYWMVRRGRPSAESLLARRDVPWMVAAVVCGGVIGPVLLMVGLSKTPASSTSLLLNLEGVLTVLLAWFVFKENFDRRIAAGVWLHMTERHEHDHVHTATEHEHLHHHDEHHRHAQGPDDAAVTALLGRLLHHAHVLKCGPRSWRTKVQIDLRTEAALR